MPTSTRKSKRLGVGGDLAKCLCSGKSMLPARLEHFFVGYRLAARRQGQFALHPLYPNNHMYTECKIQVLLHDFFGEILAISWSEKEKGPHVKRFEISSSVCQQITLERHKEKMDWQYDSIPTFNQYLISEDTSTIQQCMIKPTQCLHRNRKAREYARRQTYLAGWQS